MYEISPFRPKHLWGFFLILILLDYNVDHSSGISNQVGGKEREKEEEFKSWKHEYTRIAHIAPRRRSHSLITTLLSVPSNLKYNLWLKANMVSLRWEIKVRSTCNPAVTFPPRTQHDEVT